MNPAIATPTIATIVDSGASTPGYPLPLEPPAIPEPHR